MKLSEIKAEELINLNIEQMGRILYDGCKDDGEQADVALLLGGAPERLVERAKKAAELYRLGRVTYIIPSGGVEWEYQNEKISEAHLMERILRENGVPEEAILLENEARTTKENMIYGTLQLNRKLKIQNVKAVCIVTSASHMRRSLALANLFLPRSVKVTGCPASIPENIPELMREKSAQKWAQREIALIKGLVDCGLMEDVEC